MQSSTHQGVRSRREFLRLAGLAVGVTALAACAPVSAPAAGSAGASQSAIDLNEDVTITVACYGGPDWMTFGDSAKASFEKEFPNATLNVEYWAGDDQAFLDSITARLVAGNPPDVGLAGGSSWVDAFKGKGGLLDLRSFWDLLPSDDQNDFYAGPLQQYTGKNNELWGLPMAVFSETTGVWKPAFEEANIPLPADDWTWDDLASIAPQLTKKDASGTVERWGYRLNANDLNHLSIPVWAFGGEFFNEDYTEFTGNSPEAIAGMQVIHDLIWKAGASPSALTILEEQNDSYNAFSAGQTALWMQGSWFYSNVRAKLATGDAALQGAWDILTLPKGPKGRTTFVSANPIYAFSASKEPQWAWEVIKFMTSSETQMSAAKVFGVEMGRQSANAGAKPAGQSPEHSERTAAMMAESSKPAPQPPHYNEVYDTFTRVMQQSFWENKVPLEDAVADAKKQIDALLAQPE